VYSIFMNEIICPHCGKAFKVDEAAYANILKQVRDKAFNTELDERLQLAEQAKQDAVELALAQLRTEMKAETQHKETCILELKAQLEARKTEQQLAVNHAVTAVEKERDALRNELQQAQRDRLQAQAQAERDQANAVELTQQKVSSQLQAELQQQQATIQGLKAQLAVGQSSQAFAVKAAETRLTQEKSALEKELQQAKAAGERTTQLVKMEAQKEILALKGALKAKEVQQQLAITEALSSVEKERDSLKHTVGIF
jgi:hypothetical protein